MQNNTHNTFPRLDLSAREARLIYNNVEAPPVIDKIAKLGGFAVGEYEVIWKNGLGIRNEKGEKTSAKQSGEKIKITELKQGLFNKEPERIWGKLEEGGWVPLSGANGRGKNVESFEKNDAKKVIQKETATKQGELLKEVENGRTQECKNSHTETVTSLVQNIAGNNAENIKKVTVTKRNGKIVKLERRGTDFVELGDSKHFKIYKGDIVTIGHDFLSVNSQIDRQAGKKVPIETRQGKAGVEKAIGEVPADFASVADKGPKESEKLFNTIIENNLGKEYFNETVIAQDIVDMGIRKVCENFFVGEHGALAGLALEEKQKMPKLFDKKGELKQGALAEITKIITAAAGKIESTKESEIQADAKRFLAEVGLFVGVPTLIQSAAALIAGSQLAVAGYFPLAYIDIGRGIRQGKVKVLDRGGVKLLTDLSIVEGEIAARKTLNEDVNELKTQKTKLELIGLTLKKQTIEKTLADKNLDPKMRKKLESDQKALVSEIASRNNVSVTEPEIEAYSSLSVNKDRNKKYQELQVATNELNKDGLIGSAEKITKTHENIGENLAALESSFDVQQDKTEQLRVWYKRWFGGNIENPEAAVKELAEMNDSEVNGVNGLENRLKLRVGLWENTDLILNKVLGIEKDQTVKLEDLKALTGLMQDPVEGAMPLNGGKIELLQAGQAETKTILAKLETYFTAFRAEKGSVRGEFEHERDEGRLKVAAKILKSSNSTPEKIIRLSALASSQELQNISDRLILKANIEDGIKIRKVYQELQSALKDRKAVAGFVQEAGLDKTLSKIYKNAEWIEQKVDLKNLDQNASLHAEINDTLGAPLEKIKNLSGVLSGLAQEGLSATEKNEIKNAISGLDAELALAKTKVETLLGTKTIDARESHDKEDVKNIRNIELKAINAKFSVPVTEAAFENPADIAAFVKLAAEFKDSMGSKEAFKTKAQTKFSKYKFFKNSRGTETSNLPMISPDQVGGDRQLARHLNLLILNVEQKGKNIVDNFYDNSETRSKMHLRNSEIAAAVGRAEWINATTLKSEYKDHYIANTGRGGTEDLNHFIKGGHSGGDFGGAYKLSFERNVTLTDGREFKVKYDMLARQKCFNAVFFPNGGIEEVAKKTKQPVQLGTINAKKVAQETKQPAQLESLTPTDVAAVKRQLFLLGIPLYFETGIGGGADKVGGSGYGSGGGGKGPNVPAPQPSLDPGGSGPTLGPLFPTN